VYRARIGEPGADSVARALAAEIENPALQRLVETAVPGAAAISLE
jgi:hypothetical protein